MIPPPTVSHRDLPIGVFDSGVGGLTVARAIAAALPHERLLYLGDTARVPYGNRGPQTIVRYALNAAHTLVEQRVKALVVACNTATAYGLQALKEAYHDLPLVGVVEPVARRAASRTETGRVGVIGTRATIASRCYVEALSGLLPETGRVIQIACPLFVPLAEEGWVRGDVPEQVARHYLEAFAQAEIDMLILGCTHYPLLRDTIATTLDVIMPHHVTLLDSAQSTRDALIALLEQRDLLRVPSDQGAPEPVRDRVRFLVTDEPRGFMATAVRFFGGPIARPEHIDLTLAGPKQGSL